MKNRDIAICIKKNKSTKKVANMQRFIVKVFCLAIICGIVFGLSTSAKAVPMLSFAVSDPAPMAGDLILVDIVATDVVDLVSFNLDIGFDSSILSVSTVDPGPFLGSGVFQSFSDITGVIPFDTSIPGEIQNINDVVLGPFGVTGSGILATVHFDTISAGTSSLDFLNTNVINGTELINSAFGQITIISAPSSSVSVQSSDGEPIPEPSTVALLGIGFIMLALTGFHRWRKQQVVHS